MAQDPVSGEMIYADESNDLSQRVTGVIWSDDKVTMTRRCGKGIKTLELFRENLRWMVDLCPKGRNITVFTQPPELVQEWEQMCTYRSQNYEGLKPEQFEANWQEIMKQVEAQDKRIEIQMGTGACDRYLEAAKRYFMEKVDLHELVSGLMPDSPQGTEKSLQSRVRSHEPLFTLDIP
jgi:hypothetical protein